jgi:crotonobetainyl-CoA:carnitine CoA-transferase CaiB-like acyl-CoA transferase
MAQGLEGVRVVEVGYRGVAAGYAGKLLADLGATVIKVEPPEGDWTRHYGPWRQGHENDTEASGLYLALNANKRSMVLALDTASGFAEFAALVDNADILIHDLPPPRTDALGLDYAKLTVRNPRLTMVSITPFGLTGPYRNYAATDLIVFHAAAGGWIFADPRDPQGQPPVKLFGKHSEVMAGITATVTGLACYYAALESGQGDHVDLSMQEVGATQHGPNSVEYEYARRLIDRLMPRKYAPSDYYRCSDGYIFIVCPEDHQWDYMVKVMGSPAWAAEPRFATRWLRGGEHREAFAALLNAWTSQHTVEQVFTAAQEAHVCAIMLLRPEQVAQNKHLASRNFFREHEHPAAGPLRMPGPPVAFDNAWWRLRRPAPGLGEDHDAIAKAFAEAGARPASNSADAQRLPLAGVKVLDFTHFWAGPHATQHLGFLGAEILKIESMKRPDFTRKFNIFPRDMEPNINRGGYFNEYNQMKKSVGIDVKHPEGLKLLKQLAKKCDVAASNFSTGVMDRLGLGTEDLRAINPDMIVLEISGFGKTGLFKDYIAFGPTVVPFAGIIAIPEAGERPLYSSSGYGDPNGGLYGAYAITAALVARKLHGGGASIDATLWETTASNNVEGFINAALGNKAYGYMGNRDAVLAPHNAYPSAGEDSWIAIAVTDETQWRSLCAVIGQPRLADDKRFKDNAARKRNEDALDAIIAQWTGQHDRFEAAKLLQAGGVPAFPVYSVADMLKDPHLERRGYFVDLPHPEVGVRRHNGRPWQLERRHSDVDAPAPLMGQHTDEVLQRYLNLSNDDIAALRKAEIVW